MLSVSHRHRPLLWENMSIVAKRHHPCLLRILIQPLQTSNHRMNLLGAPLASPQRIGRHQVVGAAVTPSPWPIEASVAWLAPAVADASADPVPTISLSGPLWPCRLHARTLSSDVLPTAPKKKREHVGKRLHFPGRKKVRMVQQQ